MTPKIGNRIINDTCSLVTLKIILMDIKNKKRRLIIIKDMFILLFRINPIIITIIKNNLSTGKLKREFAVDKSSINMTIIEVLVIFMITVRKHPQYY